MRSALRASLALLAGLLVVVPGAVQAAEGKLVAATGIPIKLYGDATFAARSGVLQASPRASSTTELAHGGAELDVVSVRSEYVPGPEGADAFGSRTVLREAMWLAPGTIEVSPRGSSPLLIVEGAGIDVAAYQPSGREAPKDLWTRAQSQFSLVFTTSVLEPPVPHVRLFQDDRATWDRVELPIGTYAAESRPADAHVQRAQHALLHDVMATIRGTAAQFATGTSIRDAPGSVYTGEGWMGPGTHRIETTTYIRLTLTQGQVSISDASLRLYAPDLLVSLDGHVGLPWAEGTLKTQNETLVLGGEQVQLGGTLRIRPLGFIADGAPRITILADGDIRYYQIGLRGGLLGAEEAALVAGSVAGLGLVAALAYFWPLVKYASSAVLFPLYARVPKERTLDHKGREHLYDLIKNEPGISTNKLAKEVPFGWSTLTYHLRVLERNEAIVSVRDGRYKRFFDRQSGRFSNGRKYVLAVLKNDATLGIARFIRERPGAHQKDVAGQFGLSPSSVHWHVERLSEVGLVQKQRDAHHVRYFPGTGWEHVSQDDLASLAAAAPNGMAGALDSGSQGSGSSVPSP